MREGALPSRTNQARVVSEILEHGQAEDFRVNLIEAYDQPWKRQLEGTVGGYWGLLDSVQRALKYPPGEAISNFPFWKLQMGCGMALSVMVFGVGGADLAPAAVDAAAGVLARGRTLGDRGRHPVRDRRGQDVLRELRLRRLAALGRLAGAGIAAPLVGANAADVGAAAADVSGIARVRARAEPARSLTGMLGAVLVVTVLIAVETALGFVFDPRYKDFPFAALTMAVLPFATAGAAQPSAGRSPSDRRSGIRRACWRWPRSTRCSTKDWTTGSRCGRARPMSCSALTLWRARGVQIPK